MEIMGSMVKQWPGFITPTARFSKRTKSTKGLTQFLGLTGIVGHVGGGVEQSVDSVSAVAPHHGVPVRLCVLLYHVPDLPVLLPRLDDSYRFAKALVRDFDQILVLVAHVPHEERLVEVAVEAPVVHRDVHVAQIPVFEGSSVGDPVTDHLVDRGAARRGELVVVQRGRVAVPLEARLVHRPIDLVGGHPHVADSRRLVQHLAAQLARNTHPLDLLIVEDLDLPRAFDSLLA